MFRPAADVITPRGLFLGENGIACKIFIMLATKTASKNGSELVVYSITASRNDQIYCNILLTKILAIEFRNLDHNRFMTW